MKIPNNFRKKLENDHLLEGVVNTTISKFQEIINGNFEFFPDYTKHDITHIENVLEIADKLISEDTLTRLGSKDIACFILAAVLHDLGMHITFEGLNILLNECKSNKIIEFDFIDWRQEWDNFFDEARRWSGKKLISVFGDNVKVKMPALEKDKLTGFDKKLYGEFIRTKHPRLAHEIAIFGFPKVDKTNIPFAEGLDFDIKDIVGLIARSHGIDIRSTYNYLKDKHTDLREPYGIKVIYLMVVLRLADYLHITSDRAPEQQLEIRSFSSPFSRSEWDLHNTIKHTHMNHEDPETLFIQAKPESSDMYLKLQNLLKNIQNELDISWAVLGEIYGRYNPYSIQLRRIRSNIDDVNQYAKTVSYLPEKIIFDTDPDIVKLLVAPLYGNNPTYAIRELLQNSIDACRERQHISKNKNIEYIPEIQIEITKSDNNEYHFIIIDNGIGMKKSTLVNYFLKAGASFRKSDHWVKNFTDEKGLPKVQRNGRFGIGVFSSFLLGSEIYVKTRNVDSLQNEGLEFSATIDTEQIEVNRVTSEIGTMVKIRLYEKVAQELQTQLKEKNVRKTESVPYWFQWYKTPEPEISFCMPIEWGTIDGKDKGLEEAREWLYFDAKGFTEVKWTYDQVYYGTTKLICNGIIIPNGYSLDNFTYPNFRYGNIPLVSIIDIDCNLPLSLNRNSLLDKRLPFENELIKSICQNIFHTLVNEPDIDIKSLKSLEMRYPLVDRTHYGSIIEKELIICKQGYTLFHSYFIEKLNINKITQIWTIDSSIDLTEICLELHGIIITDQNLGSIYDFKNIIDITEINLDKKYNVLSTRVYMKKNRFEYLFDNSIDRLRPVYKRSIDKEKESNSWVCYKKENPKEAVISFDKLDKFSKNIELIVEYDISDGIVYEGKRDMASSYFTNLGDNQILIPFQRADRKVLFPSLISS